MYLILHFDRDYTNPFLPVAPSAIDGSGQVSMISSKLFFSYYNSYNHLSTDW